MRSQEIKAALKVCVLTTLVVGVAAVALPSHRHPVEAGTGMSITIEPATPTEADLVTITFEGILPTTCHEVTSSYSRGGNVIVITVDAVPIGEFCLLRVGSFSVTEEIGSLPAGAYDVEATVFEPIPFRCTLSPCSAMTTFEVAPIPVGGIAALPDVASAPLEVEGSSGLGAGVVAGIVAVVTAGALALGGAAWYARRRIGS